MDFVWIYGDLTIKITITNFGGFSGVESPFFIGNKGGLWGAYYFLVGI